MSPHTPAPRPAATLLRELLALSRTRVCLAGLAAAISAAAGMALIALVNRTLEQAEGVPTHTTLTYGTLLAVLFVSGIAAQILLVRIGHDLVQELRLRLMRRWLATPLAQQETLGGARLHTALTRDVTAIAAAIKQSPVLLNNALVLAAGLAYLAWLDVRFFGVTVMVVVVGVAIDLRLGRRVKALMQQVRLQEDLLSQHTEAAIAGRSELAMSHARRRWLLDMRVAGAAHAARTAAVRADTLWAVNLAWTTVLIFVLIGNLVYLGLVHAWLPPATVLAYALTIVFLRTPIALILDTIPVFLRGSVALQNVQSLGLGEAFSDAAPGAAPPFTSLTLHGVRYRHPGAAGEPGFGVGPIDLQVSRGDVVFLVGGNGSGKSTLMKLIAGLYPPQAGHLCVNGAPLTPDSMAAYREQAGIILSDFHVFSQVLQAPQARERAAHALQRLGLADKVTLDAQGTLSTTALSQGQRKRLALVLLMAQDHDLLLLDEWAADQDPAFRAVFYRELLPALKAAGKTVIAITHDDHYFDAADRVYRLDDGRLAPWQAP
ncbi:cyclic peptide export ABC transporter [Achromobacter sp. GG226]|uniref:cyclic peptide export ABC transporter n=1 Tax=Verticiella alkaliphila TaxID=2779529 RepID=UPI001C0E8706|nr:cyclic peptide export ABC transporter [Verticiella sp. GG226]MBU4610548.1 cyclic peptide export ABC transporter [Verticiella sp. GG226]